MKSPYILPASVAVALKVHRELCAESKRRQLTGTTLSGEEEMARNRAAWAIDVWLKESTDGLVSNEYKEVSLELMDEPDDDDDD
jgi:hypothetical protein